MKVKKKTTLSPAEEGITLALVQWLESAIIGTTAEDLEVVSGADSGEPSDPYLAVYVKVASGKQGIARAFEITIAVMSENAVWLPDDAEDILDDVHSVMTLPIDPKGDEGETGAEPFSALLAELKDMADDSVIPDFFRIQTLTEAIEPRLSQFAENNTRKIYRGTVKI